MINVVNSIVLLSTLTGKACCSTRNVLFRYILMHVFSTSVTCIDLSIVTHSQSMKSP
jgi:hypothetical protein